MRMIGMSKLLKENKNATKLKRMLMNLPLLPAQMFERGYKFIKSQANSWKLSNSFKKFFKYFEAQWIPEVLFSIIIFLY